MVTFNLPTKKHNNHLKYSLNTTTRAKITLLPVFGRHLEFRGKESPDKVSIETVEKFTPQNMGIAFGILALGGTKPEIHLGGYIPPPIATYVLKNTIATLELTPVCINHAPATPAASAAPSSVRTTHLPF